MNLGTKKSYYVFSKTDIKKFKEENNKPLEYIDLIKLVIDTNSELLKLYELNTKSVEISKFNKNDSLIHSQLLKLPLEADTDFDKILVNFNETKPPKIGKATKVDKATKDLTVINDKANYIERKDFEKISIKKISIIGFSFMTVLIIVIGFVLNQSINRGNSEQEKLSQELIITQLETSGKYDKVAQKMKDFNYPKKDIVNMYLENGQFVNALKADKKAITSVLDKIDTMNNKEQQKALNELKKANITSKKENTSIDLRLALLNKDIDFLKKNIKSVDSQALSDRIVKLFIDEKEYASANEQLKFFANKALDKQAKQAEHDDKKQALTNKVNELKKAVSDTQKQLDGKNTQLSDLHKQLDDLNKNDKSPDKGKHVDDKNKEIDNANKDKNKISDILKDQQGKEKEAQKAVDDFK
ncbi:conjugal transfer protein [Lactococcus lactis]|uniref:conjugal transfer protein n=1 Tax=Lactococcus lactis TaxID=1358 RepID=UPI0021A56ECB|nr:conjugal transfer protein [Lactococcus lactis]MDA2886794.1 conjugal transfer protein [Lactococcus lactis]MDA2886858.1 conjugal transfer protein [Lactococcus lactis]MDA2898146.1 conjugal transfer protein [Lactococcus lactis]MDA2909274.1 conjugal transfer protein [Lactococcus lactis]